VSFGGGDFLGGVHQETLSAGRFSFFLSFCLFSPLLVGLLQTLGRVMWSCLSGGGILYARTVYAHNKINARKEKEKKKKVKNGQREES
jgi:hypothetical protein